MSSWYVWAALGLYPVIPGRAELVVASPLFPRIDIRRGASSIRITAEGEGPYVRVLRVNGTVRDKPWLPASFVARGGRLDFRLAPAPDTQWGAAAADVPPFLPPSRKRGDGD